MSTRNDFFHAILNRDLQIGDADYIRDIGEQNMSYRRSLFVTNRTERSPQSKYMLDGIPKEFKYKLSGGCFVCSDSNKL